MPGPQHADALVASDPVEPGLEVDLPVAAEHRSIGIGKGLLNHILRLLPRAEHVTAEREDATVVALEEDGEGLLAPSADTANELLVRGQLEQVARRGGRAVDRQTRASPCRLHSSIIDTPVLVDEHFQFLSFPALGEGSPSPE
jgi:hypothetical protein